MKKNDIINIEITGMTDLGAGVGRTSDGQVIFCAAAVMGDSLRAKVIKVTSSYCVARIEEIISPSSARIEPVCRAFPRCGGCSFLNVGYECELEMKREFVVAALAKSGLGSAEVAPVDGAGEKALRNKVQYPYCEEGAGYYARHSHIVVPSASCVKAPEVFASIASFLGGCFRSRGISAYNEESGKGLIRHICIRASHDLGSIAVTVVVNGDALPDSDGIVAELTARFPGVASVVLNVNRERGNVILGGEYRCLYGEDAITDRLCGLDFRISAASFYQVNHDCAEMLYDKAIELSGIGSDDSVADLFCGIGTIGICAAAKKHPAKLVGVEIVPQAVENARFNAYANGVEAEFFCADADHPAIRKANVIFVDPPRKGLGTELIGKISESDADRVVYISCAPDTFARDLRLFADAGWHIGKIYPFDMFPRTGHVENVVLMTRVKE